MDECRMEPMCGPSCAPACDHCGAERVRLDDTPLADLPLAMAYVPMQRYTQVFEPEKGLCVGTIFPELDKPFLGRGVCK